MKITDCTERLEKSEQKELNLIINNLRDHMDKVNIKSTGELVLFDMRIDTAIFMFQFLPDCKIYDNVNFAINKIMYSGLITKIRKVFNFHLLYCKNIIEKKIGV